MDIRKVKKLIELLEVELPVELVELSRLLLAGHTQTEVAKLQNVSDRTIRRRLTAIRDFIVHQRNVQQSEELDPRENLPDQDILDITQTNLPEINYREFVLGRLIGQGAFSKVYRSTLQSDQSIVAIKFLKKRFWESDSANASFINEIALASKIRHPNIVRYRGVGKSPHGGVYLVSEWIDGEVLSLQTKLDYKQFFIVPLLDMDRLFVILLFHFDNLCGRS